MTNGITASSFQEGKLGFMGQYGLVWKVSENKNCLKTERQVLYELNRMYPNGLGFIQDKTVSVRFVEILDQGNYEDSDPVILRMAKGISIESLLDAANGNHEQRKIILLLIKELFNLLKKRLIFLPDLAPRNLLFDGKVITIIDFERGYIDVRNRTVDEICFLLSFLYEEWRAFLTEEELVEVFGCNPFNLNTHAIGLDLLELLPNSKRRNLFLKRFKPNKEFTRSTIVGLITFNRLAGLLISNTKYGSLGSERVSSIDKLSLSEYIDLLVNF